VRDRDGKTPSLSSWILKSTQEMPVNKHTARQHKQRQRHEAMRSGAWEAPRHVWQRKPLMASWGTKLSGKERRGGGCQGREETGSKKEQGTAQNRKFECVQEPWQIGLDGTSTDGRNEALAS
jgi:hypothetical protein